jgi:multisubunit Na+/H+ antiporter MnhE subunit
MPYNPLQPNNDINRSYDFITTYIVTIASSVLNITETTVVKDLTGATVETKVIKYSILAKDVYIKLFTYTNNIDYKLQPGTLCIEITNKYNKHTIATINSVNLDASSSGYSSNINTYYTYLSTNLYL